MEEIRINTERLVFNKIWYIHAENGDDNNIGDRHHPFKTLKKALSVCVDGDAIYLMGTNGTIYSSPVGSKPSANIAFIGDCENTILDADAQCFKYATGVSMDFYRLRIEGYAFLSNPPSGVKYNFYNCYIDLFLKLIANDAPNRVAYFYNCYFGDTLTKDPQGWYREDAWLENCVIQGPLTTWYFNIPTLKNTLVNDKFFEEEQNMVHFTYSEKPALKQTGGFYELDDLGYTGDGKNPDGTPATIGLYGGPFAWGEWVIPKKTLFKSNDKILTIQGNKLKEISNLDFNLGIDSPQEMFQVRNTKEEIGSSTISYNYKDYDEITLDRLSFKSLGLVNIATQDNVIHSPVANDLALAFDGDLNTKFAGTITDTVKPFIGQNFLQKNSIRGYTICSVSTPFLLDYSPKSWKVETSEDGLNWNLIQEVKEQPAWEGSEPRTFYFSENIKCTSMRIVITETFSTSENAMVAEIRILKEV